MSLRDALLKSGAVSGKQVKRANRQLKKSRKNKQASREKAKVVAQREQQEQEAARQAELDRKLQEAKARAALEQKAARALRLTHLIQGGHLRLSGGPARFFFVGLDGLHIQRMWVPFSVAQGLRAGAMAIAVLEQRYSEPEYVVVERQLALRIRELRESALVFFNEEPPDPADRSLDLLEDWVGPSAKH
ncbi:MAG: DUF2058 family protein [Myxococcota bacterium]|nr:DUF2058 family protein [Myxococcota bacterium]